MRPYATLDHISVPVAAIERAGAFYDAVLAPLGMKRLRSGADALGYGVEHPIFWLLKRQPRGAASAGLGLHIAFGSQSRAAVDAFHKAALAAGATDNGAPGLRTEYHPHYYGAFVLDPDGTKIEAVCHRQS